MPSPALTDEARRFSFTDPIEFQATVLRRQLWSVQRKILRALETRRHIAVKGCHASGKTFVTSGAVPWWLTRYPTGKVVTIAPTLRQVKLMWGEISLALKSSKVKYPEPSTVGLKISDDRYAIGISSSRGVNIQGFHGSNVLIIADEATGILEDIWDAVEGIRAGGIVTLLELGNPTVPSGHFHDNFTRGRANCECITISAFDSPNFAGLTIEQLLELPDAELDLSPWPFLTSRRWVKERYQQWGPTNPRYISRVLGEFPTQSDYAVFDLAWIERARREPTEAELNYARTCLVQIGIDVAAGGDAETTACARVNGIIIDRGAWSQADPPLARWIQNVRVNSGYQLGYVVMDTVGVGHYLALSLAQDGFPVVGFKAGHPAMNPEQFLNTKAEAYFNLRDMYKANYISHLPEALDEETEAQLSTIEFRERLNGQVMIETKEDARKRGVPSPDRAEAEIMAFIRVVPRQQRMEFGAWQEISPI
jgi:hypothetical protein